MVARSRWAAARAKSRFHPLLAERDEGVAQLSGLMLRRVGTDALSHVEAEVEHSAVKRVKFSHHGMNGSDPERTVAHDRATRVKPERSQGYPAAKPRRSLLR